MVDMATRQQAATTRRVTITVNGERASHEVEPRLLLVHYLREVLGLTGTHIGCDTSQCGACTVHIDGSSAKSCTILAVQADGSEVRTIEGMAENGQLHPLQEGFWEEHGLQCGYCTPGMIMSAADLLNRNPNPSESEIRHALHGNLCRCTGYQHIVNAIQYAAQKTGAREDLDAAIEDATPFRFEAEPGQAPFAEGITGQAVAPEGTPMDEALDQAYGIIRGEYPDMTDEDLARARAHPLGQLEGFAESISERTGDAVDSVRERLRGLFRRNE